MLLALDPNICIAAAHDHSHSQDLLDEIFEARDYVQLAIDEEEQAILKEYQEILPNLGERQQKYMQALFSRLEMLPAPVDPIRAAYLDDKGCSTPVEPQLIMVCSMAGCSVPILVVGPDFTHAELRSRGIHDPGKVEVLRSDCIEFRELTVFSALHAARHIRARLRTGLPYPYNQQELRSFLKEQRYRESDQLEFKQPDENPRCQELTQSILQSSMEAVCAFANSYGGTVLVGIHEEMSTGLGHVTGFPLKYKGKNKSEDQVLRMLMDDDSLLRSIQPKLSPKEQRSYILKVAEDRCVLVLRIEKCNPPLRRYRGKAYYRHGTQNITRD